jgi:hypothetical protein
MGRRAQNGRNRRGSNWPHILPQERQQARALRLPPYRLPSLSGTAEIGWDAEKQALEGISDRTFQISDRVPLNSVASVPSVRNPSEPHPPSAINKLPLLRSLATAPTREPAGSMPPPTFPSPSAPPPLCGQTEPRRIRPPQKATAPTQQRPTHDDENAQRRAKSAHAPLLSPIHHQPSAINSRPLPCLPRFPCLP